MIGYSELLQTIGAMVIFSLILISATSLIQRNTHMQIEGELEQEVIAVAQDIIEEGRTKEFDEVSVGATAPPAAIPGDFEPVSDLGPETSGTEDDDEDGDGKYERHEFDDFDDYHGWEDQVETEHGVFNIRAEVCYASSSTYECTNTQTTFKKMKVEITNKFLEKSDGSPTLYNLEFVRNYYAD